MLTRPTTALTYAGARLALDAALAEADRIGGAFNVAVTDGGGTVLAFARMDGAFANSGPIAIDKARTVAGFSGLASDTLYALIADEEPVRLGIAGRDGIAAFAGGLPLQIGADVVGAIGASGGSADQDKAVAQAGATALISAATTEAGS